MSQRDLSASCPRGFRCSILFTTNRQMAPFDGLNGRFVHDNSVDLLRCDFGINLITILQ